MTQLKARADGLVELDMSDVDRWVGKPLGGARLIEPITRNDLRRWAQGMANPNPLYFDEDYARQSRFGRMVAPQSFGVCTDTSHGASPAIQGAIPGQHMIFGGDEWWFFGGRIEPGDTITHDRMLFDYKVAETKFAGPTMFSRGDTTYVNQRGEVLCKQRSTSVRYLAENARKLGMFKENVPRAWSDQEIEDLEKQKLEYYQSFLDLGHEKRLFIKVGDKLPTRPIGPHTIATFTTEWRSYLMTVWGAMREYGESSTPDAGWLPEMSRDRERAKIDPTNADGLYKGPSRGHVHTRYAQLIGMPREYGYGASMGAWILDYLTNWCGEWGSVQHSNMQYRAPALSGDVTFLNGEVVALDHDRSGGPIATVKVVMTNQDDVVMAQGRAEIEPPDALSALSGPSPSDPRLTFARFLADAARQHADRVAVVSDEATLTYAELEAKVAELARALIGAGVAKGARVAVWFANSPESIVATYAVCSVGAVLVPVNTFASASERDYILRHSDASALLMQPALGKQRFLDDLLESHPEIARGAPGRLRVPALPHLRHVACFGLDAARGGVESWGDLLACGRDVSDALLDAVRDAVVPSDDGLIIYTSGTTSQPKGVLHTQRAAVLQGHRFAEMLVFTPEDRVFTTYPFFWTAGIAMSIGGAFAAGARLLVQPVFEPEGALALMERERATSIHAWPHQQKAIAEHPSAAQRDLSSMVKIEVHSPIAALAGVKENLYDYGTSYGLSETFTICSATRADAPAEERRANNGRPCPGMQLRIVDPVTGAPLGVGEEGEIAVKGVTLMRSYYKVAPEQVFDADGYYHTQDGGSIDADGRLVWNGRLGNLIKTGGANVSPVELQEILESHPELKVGIPVGIEHPTLGEALVVCAVAVDGATPDEAEVRAWLRARVAAYKVPRRVLFFSADELAYTSNQKIQIEPLRQAALRRLREERAEIQGYRFEPT